MIDNRSIAIKKCGIWGRMYGMPEGLVTGEKIRNLNKNKESTLKMEKPIDRALEKISPERRLFVKTLLHASYVIPAIVSISMVDQKLDLSTAHAQSGNTLP